MIAARDYFGRTEVEHLAALAVGAERDVVFLMDLRTSASNFRCTPEELRSFAERRVERLLPSGVTVGRGDPDAETWGVQSDANDRRPDRAKHIVQLWSADPLDHDAFVFAKRTSGTPQPRTQPDPRARGFAPVRVGRRGPVGFASLGITGSLPLLLFRIGDPNETASLAQRLYRRPGACPSGKGDRVHRC